MESLDFDDLSPVEIPCKIGGVQYILREASEDASVKFRNATIKASRYNDDGKLSHIEGLADAEPLLVSLCLFPLHADGSGEAKSAPVPLSTVLAWPRRVVTKLYKKIREISGMEEEDDTEEVLEKRLTETQTKLAALRKGKTAANGDGDKPAPFSPAATQGTSGWREN